jgi:orotidine-5'-phosphate decarboxylase
MANKINDFGLIFADDVIYPEKALVVAKEVASYIDATKLTISNTLQDLRLLSRTKEATEKTVIADFKVADVGVWNQKMNLWEGTNEKTVSMLMNAGADYVICHTFPGTSSIQECVEVGHALGGGILTLPFMTHKGAELFFDQPVDSIYTRETLEKLKINVDSGRCKTISDLILLLGEYFNVDGFIGPANNPQKLRRYREFTQRAIYGPGIGRQAKDNVTPQQQLEEFYKICGKSSGAIIGSAIYGDPKNPDIQNAVKYAEEFRTWRNEVVTKLFG